MIFKFMFSDANSSGTWRGNSVRFGTLYRLPIADTKAIGNIFLGHVLAEWWRSTLGQYFKSQISQGR